MRSWSRNGISEISIVYAFCGLSMLLAASDANAAFWNRRLQVFKCPDSASARECNSSCAMIPGFEFEFKVNRESGAVILDMFQGGKFKGTEPQTGTCRIVDAKNWVCGPERQYRGAPATSMANGIYSRYRTEDDLSEGLNICAR